jgi:hypothetical protein
LKIEYCGDAYRALAEIAKRRHAGPLSVVVDLELITAPEQRFFSLAPTLNPELTVYVYAADGSAEQIRQAVANGASSEFTDQTPEAIRRTRLQPPFTAKASAQATEQEAPPPTALGADISSGSLEQQAVSRDITAEPATEQRMTDTGAQHDLERDHANVPADRPTEAIRESKLAPSPASDPVHSVPATHREPSAQNEVETSSAGQARVPWLRYRDMPSRKRPSDTPGTKEKDTTTTKSTQETDAAQRLLSDEELQALIGDAPDPADSDLLEDDDPSGVTK